MIPRSTLQNVTDNHKRWIVFGIALNKVLVSQVRPFVEQEVQKEYGNLKTSHNIHTQSTSGRLKIRSTFLKYENINGNDAHPRLPGGRYDYSLFDCKVLSPVDFAKLYVENYMAKFNAFDEHCDASAVLALLGKVPVFSHAVPSAAGDVRKARNAWAHCKFSDWDPLNFQQRFAEMEQLVKALGLPSADESDLLKELKDWEMKGTILCMSATIDPDLVKTVQQDVSALKNDVDKLIFEEEVNRENLKEALQDVATVLEELQKRVSVIEHEHEVIKQEQEVFKQEQEVFKQEQEVFKQEQEVLQQDQSTLCEKMKTTEGHISELKSEQKRVRDLGEHLDTRVSTVQQEQEVIKQVHNELCDKVNATQGQISAFESEQEDVQRRVTHLEDQQNTTQPQINYEIANCEADITFFAERHDVDTRQWLLEDFDKWFSDPGNSRAYVLLGDPGIGKSVMAGVLAQRSNMAGNLGAAYFCRHNDGTRNDPRYLLGTVACQLCECNSEYNSIVGGEGGVRKLLSNSNLGVQELFTKLLQEPLGMSTFCQQRKLVIIDALDETQYESRDDFLDLIMNRFPLLPKWLVFFITSRPEETVQSRLNKYSPCIKICAGNSKDLSFYQQHERDIKLFLEKSVDFSYLPYSAEDITEKSNGLFLYAFYIARVLKDPVHSGKIDQLSDRFLGDIDNFFCQNFKRVFDKVGANLYRKLFGCAIVAPSPLPVSFISFILQRENSDLDEQEVIDAVSLFVVLRTSDQSFTFLHNLIPTWLTDKKKASRKLLIKRIEAGEYFRDIIVEFLSAAVVNQQWETPPSIEADLFDYCFRVGVRFLCEYHEKGSLKIVYCSLTSYQFVWKRIQSNGIGIYSVIADLKLAIATVCQRLSHPEKEILQDICLALENNCHVLQKCPHLLHSCLRNASKAVQVNVAIPDGVSTTWMERKGLPYPAWEIPRGMSCFAFSPDKKLLAGRKGQCISLFDACSFEKVFGPMEVTEASDDINHLEFSPDGKFLFFGRLDKWFSVEKRCVEEYPQFSKNFRCYKWSSFIFDGSFIFVQRERPWIGMHNVSCELNIFRMWSSKESRQPSNESTGSQRHNLDTLDLCSALNSPNIYQLWPFRERDRFRSHSDPPDLCNDCLKFQRNHVEPTLAIVRQRVIDLYPEIFEYQVWDVQSGRPFLEELFSLGVDLSTFSKFCFNTAALECNERGFSVPYGNDLSHAFGKEVNNCQYYFVGEKIYTSTHFQSELIAAKRKESYGSFCVLNAPPVFLNAMTSSRISLDQNWMAGGGYVYEGYVYLLKKESHIEHFDYEKPVRVIEKVKHFAFTNDCSVFLYSTKQKLLHALSLQSGRLLSSVSSFIPLYCTPEKQVGFLFRAEDEERFIFAKDIPSDFLKFFSIPSETTPLEVKFSLTDTILTLHSGMMLTFWKTTDFDRPLTFSSEVFLRDPSPEVVHVKKCGFSQNGKLIATHQGTKILLFNCHKFLECVFDEDYEYNVPCLTFSADSSLLLYCIQRSNVGTRFYVWDVQNTAKSASFDSLNFPSVDRCCFLSDQKKLVICGELNVEIWEFAGNSCHRLRILKTLGPYNEFDKFTHCIVSTDNELLVCCLADRILLYPFSCRTQQNPRQVPHGHLGRIEFCQFLKGTRYLISYGVDGTVFLSDLSEWKAIAYARVAQGRESIVSMTVSGEEDKVVCLTSFGRLSVIKLCGLKCAMPSKLPSLDILGNGNLAEASRGPQIGGQTVATVKGATVSDNKDISEDIFSNDWMLTVSDNSDDSDEDESDE
ncbi:hypothetical protein ACROYT_G011667 [Oculina patagonica]